MDRLPIGDDRRYRHNIFGSTADSSRVHSPRLPTPEYSRSSMEASDNTGHLDITFKADTNRSQLSTSGPSERASHQQYPMSSSLNRNSMPRSPPYDSVDEPKPTLPPLKMILGDKLTSPPRTPTVDTTPAQVRPREPTYTTETYRPLSLYPNKRQKLEPMESAPPMSSISYASPHSTVLPSLMRAAMPSHPTYSQGKSQQYAQQNSLSSRRPSTSRPTSAYASHSPAYASPAAPQPQRNGAPFISLYPAPPAPREAPSSYPPVTTPDVYASSMRRHTDSAQQSPVEFRGPPINNHEQHYGVRLDAQRASAYTATNGSTYASPLPEESRKRERAEYFDQPEEAVNGVPMSYKGGQMPSGFMPGEYEHFYAKARKRSNLPKHSTEIMRAWFDQNIANPYPSEDQKAMFANATGISLTQVSNWFINHRRRCPELRDRRVDRRKT